MGQNPNSPGKRGASAVSRRRILGQFLAGGVLCPICASMAGSAGLAAESGDHAVPHWSYGGEGGPEHWGALSGDFRVCSLGQQQTPIDLSRAVRAETGAVQPMFQQMPLTVLNNGHTIQVNCAPGSQSRISGRSFDLLQFHFHHPSEHLLSGRAFELELHFVHKSAEGQLAVLGIFIRRGGENAALAPIWAAMPREAGDPVSPGVTIDPAALLPIDRRYFRYMGSLTTPPCSEGVLWTVFAEPIEVSPDQIRQFAELFPVNARPVQPLNSRFLLESI